MSALSESGLKKYVHFLYAPVILIRVASSFYLILGEGALSLLRGTKQKARGSLPSVAKRALMCPKMKTAALCQSGLEFQHSQLGTLSAAEP